MPDADPVSGPGDARGRVSARAGNLALRVASALVLAPAALITAYFDGWPFVVFWGLAAIVVLAEWLKLVSGAMWILAGLGYAATLWLAPVLLRADPGLGFHAIILLFAIVWTTDIVGYFAGRAFGGPKLLPAISPKKTWSGAIAGTLGAVLAGVLVASFTGLPGNAIAMLALLLSIMAQLGDLFESWVKRQFGAKDASQVIPGHGGMMDRLDGFWAATLIGSLLGAARGGLDHAASGLLVW